MGIKATPHYFEGIKFISLSDLPVEQVRMFSGWVSTASFVNRDQSARIGTQDLVKYEEYEYWFDNHYLAEKDWDQIL